MSSTTALSLRTDRASFSSASTCVPAVPQIAIAELDAQSIVKALRAHFAALGQARGEVVVRLFGLERLSCVLATGNDRDKSSHVWSCGGCDASSADQTAAGITADRLIYANRLRLDGDRGVIVFNHLASGPADEFFEPMRALGNDNYAVAVYAPEKLTQAPNAEVEYWFKGPPREALLCIVRARPRPAPRAEPRSNALSIEPTDTFERRV